MDGGEDVVDGSDRFSLRVVDEAEGIDVAGLSEDLEATADGTVARIDRVDMGS